MSRRRLSQRQLRRIREAQERRRERLAGQSQRQILEQNPLGPPGSGLVIANFGPTLIVEDQAGGLHRCALRQNLDTAVCGDRVVWQAITPGEGVVSALEARRSLLTRPDYSGRLKPVAANLDTVAVVFAPEPPLNEFLIDRYLVAIHAMGVAGILVLNKVDLLDGETRATLWARLASYRRIGYPVVSASTREPGGLDDLHALLRTGTAILVGQSGVGKSSLIKALLPDREIRVQALSEATGKGTHTTTTSTLYHLPGGGDLIDSPGVRSFELVDIAREQLEAAFPEFSPHREHCRFANCSHDAEPGCAVQAAVRRGEVEARRLASYQQMRASINA
mgnify:CR=1 FL=1